MLGSFPIVRIAEPRTIRLVTTARLRDPVLKRLVETEEERAELAEIEGATSQRLIAQLRGTSGVGAREFVFSVPGASFINAAFAYFRPRSLNRFNGPGRGAWYAALDAATCIAEIGFHMTRELAAVDRFHATVDYAEMHASFAGRFLDLRGSAGAPCLDPDPAIGYPAGNVVADAARASGLNGIVYPSVRHAGGTCLVALLPNAVQSVAQGKVYRLTWDGRRAPSVSEVG